MRRRINFLLCILLVFAIIFAVAGCKKSNKPDPAEETVSTTDISTSAENTEDTTESDTEDDTKAETESDTEPETKEPEQISDQRKQYWSSDYCFSVLPIFSEADFTGYMSSGNKQSVAFENVTQDMAEEYIDKVKSESWILDASVREMDNYISFDAHDEQNVYYFIYYDKEAFTLDITADTSAKGQIVY